MLISHLSPMESVGIASTGEVPTYLLSTEQAPLVEEEQDEGGLEDILQVFKIFKLARVLKLARHSPGLQVYKVYIFFITFLDIHRYLRAKHIETR